MGLSSPSGAVDAVPLGPQRRLRPVRQVELAEDPRQVRLDGLLADLQAAGDQLVRQALDERVEHLALTRREARQRVRLGAGGENGARGARIEWRLAARGRPDALRDLLRGDVL